MPQEEFSLADLLLRMLANKPLGNAKAREALGLSEAAYESLKAELLAEGKIVQGRGRGGSIRLPDADEPKGLKAEEPLTPKRGRGRPPKANQPEANGQEPKMPKANPSAKLRAGDAKEPDAAQAEQAFLKELDKKLWTAACKLQQNLDAAVYKHAVLGLVFLKYVSDSFEIRQKEVEQMLRDPESDFFTDPAGFESSRDYNASIQAELEIRDYYTQKNVFWVPPLARWNTIKDNAKLPSGTVINVAADKPTYTITSLGKLIDDALEAVERENPKLKGVLNKTYTQLQLDPANLSSLIDLIATIPFAHGTMRAKDILGHVYEYFLGQFALAEGKQGGQFYTPKSIVSLIVRMLQPFKGRIYDPAMGSGGFFVQSEELLEKNFSGKLGDISVYGQESNPTTWRLAAMNMAIRGIDFNFGKEPANSFTNDQHPDLRADYVMANPPFNVKEWWDKRLENDPRWQYGTPPTGNANYAWLQHMIYHLAPQGLAGVVLSNGAMSGGGVEAAIRKKLVESDIIDCMVSLPGQLFFSTSIGVTIWILAKDKKGARGIEGKPLRNRSGHTLFIDARNMGYMKDRTHKDFNDDDLTRIARTYQTWCGIGEYRDVKGFCMDASMEDIQHHKYALVPGRYVGFPSRNIDAWDREKLVQEVEELQSSLSQISTVTDTAMRLLTELVHG